METNPPLCDSAVRLFSYACDEDISVKDYVEAGDLGNLFHLPLSVEAFEELSQLQLQLSADTLDSSLPDT